MSTLTNNPNDQDNLSYCAHPGCHCKVQPDEEYCSEECRNLTDDDPCSCGHSDCEPRKQESA